MPLTSELRYKIANYLAKQIEDLDFEPDHHPPLFDNNQFWRALLAKWLCHITIEELTLEHVKPIVQYLPHRDAHANYLYIKLISHMKQHKQLKTELNQLKAQVTWIKLAKLIKSYLL